MTLWYVPHAASPAPTRISRHDPATCTVLNVEGGSAGAAIFRQQEAIPCGSETMGNLLATFDPAKFFPDIQLRKARYGI
jgi:hypothetical protein